MRIVLLTVLSVASSTTGFGGTPFTGTVADMSGGAISGAMVLFHWDSAGSAVGLTTNIGIKNDLIIKTDEKGSFMAELPSGFYDVFFSATGFTPACRKIRIGLHSGEKLTMRMNVDPLVTKELGDEVLPTPKR